MKKTTLFFVMLFIILAAKAQKKNVYFLKDNGKFVKEQDSADFIRVIEEPDSGETNFVLREFYPNGKPKLLGKVC